MKKIKVTISNSGKPTFEAEGFKGGECLEATKPLETIFAGGKDNVVKEFKPDYFEIEEEKEKEYEIE